MNNDLHRHLDGELDTDALDSTSRGEAEQWDRMVASFRREAPRGTAPAWLEQRVMAEISALPARGPVRRALDWLTRPAPVRLSPLSGVIGAGALATAVLLLQTGREPTAEEASPVEQVVYVQFVLEAPAATSVAVAGDFSGWEPAFALQDPDGDGVWSARVPVRPGVHAYMFLVDETDWRTDPNAGRYQDDGFGNRNAVLAVGASG
jgi:hypothetical protein